MLLPEQFSNQSRAGLLVRGIEWLLACLGLAAILYCAFVWTQAREAGRVAAGFAAHTGADAATTRQDVLSLPVSESVAPPMNTGVIGRLDIPALDLSAPITEGIGDSDLRHGIGHVPGTAVAGGLGTMGLAGHRDTYFRRLRRVRNGMQIVVRVAEGAYRYQIDSTEIVLPEQVEVLDVVDRPGLALITCYPFDYIGAAPRRFIVHAHLLSVAPETN